MTEAANGLSGGPDSAPVSQLEEVHTATQGPASITHSARRPSIYRYFSFGMRDLLLNGQDEGRKERPLTSTKK